MIELVTLAGTVAGNISQRAGEIEPTVACLSRTQAVNLKIALQENTATQRILGVSDTPAWELAVAGICAKWTLVGR